MSKMLGIIGLPVNKNKKSFILETINLISTLDTEIINTDISLFAESSLKNAPLKGKRIYEDHNCIAIFCGDLIGFNNIIPMKLIIDHIKSEKYENFKDFSGQFAIAYHEKKSKNTIIISDRRSQKPIYYKKIDNGFIFSSELPTFCRLLKSISFNEKWLYDYLFFNYPVFQTTFLKNIFKMPPGSVLTYNFKKNNINIKKYAGIFKRNEILLKESESFKTAIKTFKETIPAYYKSSENIACALTGGWDGRTVLSFAEDTSRLTAYTYGVPGCGDLIVANKIAQKVKIQHMAIPFGDDFVDKLPSYIIKSVYL